MEGTASSELTQIDAVEGATDLDPRDFEPSGGAGQGAEEPGDLLSNGVILGLDGDDLTGTVTLAAGSSWSGDIELYCCRDGSYSVYAYEGGLCSDPDSWDVEKSARIADVACDLDRGTAAYARDPAEDETTAFVIYDASGKALGCADVSTEELTE